MSDSLEEHLLRSKGGLVPPALLQAGVHDRAIRLYALVRSLSAARDTYREKDSLASVLGWGRSKIYEAATELEALGWLTRERRRLGTKWVSIWTAHAAPSRSPLQRTASVSAESATADSGISESATADKRAVRHSGQEVSPPQRTRTPHLPPTYTPPWGGTQLAELDLCFASLTSWQAQRLPQGHKRLREALASVLARATAPRGVTGEQLVMAWLERLTGTRGVGGMRDAEAVLIAEARKRDAAADALAYAEAVAEGRKRPPADQTRAPPEPQGETEQVDLSALERISSRQASPTTTRSRGA